METEQPNLRQQISNLNNNELAAIVREYQAFEDTGSLVDGSLRTIVNDVRQGSGSFNLMINVVMLEVFRRLVVVSTEVMYDVLEHIERVTGDDFCEELGMTDPATLNDREKKMFSKLSKVYRLSHAHNPRHSCYDAHEEWREHPTK